jgi:hypothetical protein
MAARLFLLLSVCAVLNSGCNDKTRSKVAAPPAENELMPLSGPAMPEEEYADLADKANKGDAEAAYQLYNNFSYCLNRNYGLAYYWCLRARKLGSAKVTEKEIQIAEKNILSEASAGRPNPDAEEVKAEDLLKP